MCRPINKNSAEISQDWWSYLENSLEVSKSGSSARYKGNILDPDEIDFFSQKGWRLLAVTRIPNFSHYYYYFEKLS